MRFFSLLALFCAVSLANSTDIANVAFTFLEGNFEWDGLQYTATVDDQTMTVDGPDYIVISGSGKHLPGKNQSDVQMVQINNQFTKYLPGKMEGLFWNLVAYRAENSQIEFLGNFPFYKNLRFLHLDNNLIKEVPRKVFTETGDMEWISINDNQIENLEADLFANMPKLRFVSFAGNRIRKLNGDLFKSNNNLRFIYFNGNEIASVGVDLVRHLTQISIANFDSNTCINDAFYNDPSAIENLGRQFTTFCSGQCDEAAEAIKQMNTIEDHNKLAKQQNRAFQNKKEKKCRRQQKNNQSSLSSSSSSSE